MPSPGSPGAWPRSWRSDLPRSVPELHLATGYPDHVDPEGKLIRRGDGQVAFTFGPHRDHTLEEVARTDRGFLDWVLRKDFSEQVKAAVCGAMGLGQVRGEWEKC
jgi:hypothetical protein